MFHTREDEERLFKEIEEQSRRIRERRKKDEDEKFNKLMRIKKYVYKLMTILEEYQWFTTPEVSFLDEFIIVKFRLKNYNKLYQIEKTYTEEYLENIPIECLRKELDEKLRELYQYDEIYKG
jgi:hypothetical protein